MRVTTGGRLRAASLFLILCVLSLPAEAAETQNFGIDPHPLVVQGKSRRAYDLGVSAGTAVRDAVRVYNKTRKTIRLSVFGADAERSADGTVGVQTLGADMNGVGGWIRLDKQEVTLKPGGSEIIEFFVARPKGAGPGLGAIVAQETAPASQQGSIDLVQRIALLVQVSDGNLAASLRIERARVEVPLSFVPSQGKVDAILVNGTASGIRSKVRITVRTLTGRNYELAPLTVELKAGEKRTISVPWGSVPRLGGLVKASVQASGPSGDALLTTPRELIIPIWLLVLLAVAAFAFVYRRRRRGSLAKDALVEEPPVAGPQLDRLALSLTKLDAGIRRALDAATPRSATAILGNLASRLAETESLASGVLEFEQTIAAYSAALDAARNAIRSWAEADDKAARSKLDAAGRKLKALESTGGRGGSSSPKV